MKFEINTIKLGREGYVIKDGEIKMGKISGFSAEFYEDWEYWLKTQKKQWLDYGGKILFNFNCGKFLQICLTLKSPTSRGTKIWINQDQFFSDKNQALIKLNQNKREHKLLLKNRIKELEQELKKLEI